MASVYLFADKAGDFAFNREGGSRYFIIGSVTMRDCGIGAELLQLRRQLVLAGQIGQGHAEFHAAEDRQAVRNAVFDLLVSHDFRIDATILDKTKTLPRLAVGDVVRQLIRARSYQTAFWPAQADPCLQVADYVTWAIQRKYERGDARSFDLISKKIVNEFEPFQSVRRPTTEKSEEGLGWLASSAEPPGLFHQPLGASQGQA